MYECYGCVCVSKYMCVGIGVLCVCVSVCIVYTYGINNCTLHIFGYLCMEIYYESLIHMSLEPGKSQDLLTGLNSMKSVSRSPGL